MGENSVGSSALENTFLIFCFEENLAIELDGQDHYSDAGIERDVNRDEFLKGYGIKVLRFENEEVFKNTEEVLEIIKKHFEDK